MPEKSQERVEKKLDELYPQEKKQFWKDAEKNLAALIEERKKQIRPGRRGLTKKKVKDLHKWIEGEVPKISVDHRTLCDLIEVTHGEISCYVPATLEGMCSKFFTGFAMVQTMVHNCILEIYDYTISTGNLPDPKELETIMAVFERAASNMYKAWEFTQPEYRTPKHPAATLKDFWGQYIKIENKLAGGKDGHLVPLRETLQSLNDLKDKIPENLGGIKDETPADELLNEFRERRD